MLGQDVWFSREWVGAPSYGKNWIKRIPPLSGGMNCIVQLSHPKIKKGESNSPPSLYRTLNPFGIRIVRDDPSYTILPNPFFE